MTASIARRGAEIASLAAVSQLSGRTVPRLRYDPLARVCLLCSDLIISGSQPSAAEHVQHRWRVHRQTRCRSFLLSLDCFQQRRCNYVR